MQIANLFQTGVLVINDVDNILVIADDSQLTGRDVNSVKHKAVEMKFLDFALNRFLSPNEVIVTFVTNSHKSLLRRTILDAE